MVLWNIYQASSKARQDYLYLNSVFVFCVWALSAKHIVCAKVELITVHLHNTSREIQPYLMKDIWGSAIYYIKTQCKQAFCLLMWRFALITVHLIYLLQNTTLMWWMWQNILEEALYVNTQSKQASYVARWQGCTYYSASPQHLLLNTTPCDKCDETYWRKRFMLTHSLNKHLVYLCRGLHLLRCIS